MPTSHYLIALGSNVRHSRFGLPQRVIERAFSALDEKKLTLIARSRLISSSPLGPSRRTYANAGAIIESAFDPSRLLKRLKKIERRFGRADRGGRWGPRVLDLDIILWSGGAWTSADLVIPHREFRHRRFVLDPLVTIAGAWRDPLTGLTVRHLKARLDRKRPAA